MNYLYQYLSLCPAAAVEVAVADGFGEVFGLDVFAAVEVGYGASHLEDAVVGTGTHVELRHGFFEESQAIAVDGAIFAEHS